MKKYLIVLICSFFVHSITNAQSVDQLRNNYTGNTTWNATTGVLKFSSNGTINFTQNGWKIPDNVKKGLELISVDNVDDVLKVALTKPLIPIEWDEAAELNEKKAHKDSDTTEDQDIAVTH